jgi:hypothetical protein
VRKNIRKVPQAILDRISSFDQDDVVVACVKRIKPEDVARYAHLKLRMEEGKLMLPAAAPPDPSSGRYSHSNLFGSVKIRRDLPKVSKAIEREAPNWRGSGTHTITQYRDVYLREFYAPKEVELSVSLLRETSADYVVKFAIEQVLNRRTKHFDLELFYNLNLLQENIGAADVFKSATSIADYAATVSVDWQILPPGKITEIVEAMLSGKRSATSNLREALTDRVSVLAQMKPQNYIAGSDGFLRYFGAKFGDDFVVFENARYGNALYLMYESWQELSQRSRVDLLSNPDDRFERILHASGWEKALQDKIHAYRQKKR